MKAFNGQPLRSSVGRRSWATLSRAATGLHAWSGGWDHCFRPQPCVWLPATSTMRRCVEEVLPYEELPFKRVFHEAVCGESPTL